MYDGTACKLFFKDEIKYVRVEIFDSLITAAVRIHSREYGWQNHTFVWEPVRTLSRSHDIIPFRQYLVIDDAFVKKTTDRLGAHPFAAVTDKREK